MCATMSLLRAAVNQATHLRWNFSGGCCFKRLLLLVGDHAPPARAATCRCPHTFGRSFKRLLLLGGHAPPIAMHLEGDAETLGRWGRLLVVVGVNQEQERRHGCGPTPWSPGGRG